MRNPDAPFLELGFYFADLDGQKSLERLVRYFVYKTSEVPTAIFTLDNANNQNSPLTSYDINMAEISICQTGELWKLFSDPARIIKKVVLEKGTQIVKDAREFAVQLPIMEESAHLDHNPVAVWIEGEAFSHPWGEMPIKSRRIGSKALAAFRELILFLKPSYAAITVDYALECPSDLRSHPRTLAFYDFYLAREYVGEDGLLSVARIQPNAYHEALPDGQITCSTDSISPDKAMHVNRDVLSSHVGRMLACIAAKKHGIL